MPLRSPRNAQPSPRRRAKILYWINTLKRLVRRMTPITFAPIANNVENRLSSFYFNPTTFLLF